MLPTHYLGNLILGLPWVLQVLKQHPGAIVVVDTAFQPLIHRLSVPADQVLYYPRREMAKHHPLSYRFKHYLQFVAALRRYRRHCLIDLEGERFSGILSRLSGCKQRIGPATRRAHWFYTEARELNYNAHRFSAFGEILGKYATTRPSSYLDFQVPSDPMPTILKDLNHSRLAVIHPAASKTYKLWPQQYFVQLARRLSDTGYQVVWIGSGDFDAEIIAGIERSLTMVQTVNCCNHLSLLQLISLFHQARLFIGCDSGPMHLAASLKLPVFGLFGPSSETIWAPLGEYSNVLRSRKPCGPDCNTRYCRYDHQCLKSLSPAEVMHAITQFEQCDQPADPD